MAKSLWNRCMNWPESDGSLGVTKRRVSDGKDLEFHVWLATVLLKSLMLKADRFPEVDCAYRP